MHCNVWCNKNLCSANLCDRRLTRIIRINKTRAEKGRFTVRLMLYSLFVHTIGSSAEKVNAGVLIFFVTVLGWFLNHSHV